MNMEERKKYSLRMTEDFNALIEREAKKLGMSKNSYIIMILHKELQKEK